MNCLDPNQPGIPAPILRMPWHDTADVLLATHRLVMFIGPPGVGKTSFVREAARNATGSSAEVIQGTAETELAHIWGFFSLVGGETRFCEGPLPRALRAGRWLVVEEFSLVPLEVRASLLGLRGQDSLVNPFSGEEVEVHDDFRLVATSNPESVACRQSGSIAHALVDDFLILEVPPISAEMVEVLLKHDFPSMADERRQEVMRCWSELETVGLEQAEGKGLRLSYRAARHLALVLEAGLPLGDAIQVALVNKYVMDADVHEAAGFRAGMLM